MLPILLSPLGIFFIFRVLIPLYWCTHFIVTNSGHELVFLVLIHLIYLCFEGVLIIITVLNIYKYVNFAKKFNILSLNVLKLKNISRLLWMSLVALFSIIFLNLDIIPIFHKGGSDAIIFLGEAHKVRVWFVVGVKSILSLLMLTAIIYLCGYRRIYWIIIVVILAALTGKKGAIIWIISHYIFLNYILKGRKVSPVNIFVLVISGMLYAVVQYYRTINTDINIILNPLEIFLTFLRLVYISSTIYLQQFISNNGIYFADIYSNTLGNFGPLIYILNPFLKFFFGFGIYKAIGPFMVEKLYGYATPHGVNPTLFFEFIFVYGNILASLLSFPMLLIIFILCQILIKKVILEKSIILKTFYYFIFLRLLGFTVDTLNNIRSLVFASVLLVMYISYKIIKNTLNSTKNISASSYGRIS